MSRKNVVFIVFLIACSLHAMAQTTYYYYYQGNKIPLTLNDNKVCVSVPKEYDNICQRIHKNVNVLSTIADDSFDIIVISKSDYRSLTSLDSWQEDAKCVIITSSYYTENNDEVVATPYINLRLKDEQDIDLLNTYVQEFKLKNLGNSPLMPLWYILSMTPESKKSSLECANELFESGYFASSISDLASLSSELGGATQVQLIPSAKTEEASEYYDMLGRRVDTPSGLTIVVTRYSDGTVSTEKKLF